MNESTSAAAGDHGAHRQRVVLATLVVLYLALLGATVVCWPEDGSDPTFYWQVEVVCGELSALVSLAALGMAARSVPLATRLTTAMFLPAAVCLTLIVTFTRAGGFTSTAVIVLLAAYVTTAHLAQGILMTSVMVVPDWWRRFRARRNRAAAPAKRPTMSHQFGLRHVILWMFLTGIVLNSVRGVDWHDIPDYEWRDLGEVDPVLLFYSSLGAFLAFAGWTTIVCVGAHRGCVSWLAVVAVNALMAGVTYLLCRVWSDGNAQELPYVVIWPVTHFICLAISLLILRLAGTPAAEKSVAPAGPSHG